MINSCVYYMHRRKPKRQRTGFLEPVKPPKKDQ